MERRNKEVKKKNQQSKTDRRKIEPRTKRHDPSTVNRTKWSQEAKLEAKAKTITNSEDED